MDKFPFLGAIHSGMIEEMYNSFLQDPKNVNKDRQNFFQGLS